MEIPIIFILSIHFIHIQYLIPTAETEEGSKDGTDFYSEIETNRIEMEGVETTVENDDSEKLPECMLIGFSQRWDFAFFK